MNAKWTFLVVMGTVLTLLSSQVMAQPWGVGGQGPGFGRGRGMGRMAQGTGPMRQQMRAGDPQDDAPAWCPFGIGPWARGAWNSPGQGQLGLGAPLARRLGLSENQVEKIRDIVAKARSRTMAAIKEVLTEEQAEQLELMRGRAGQFGQGGRGPAVQDGFGGPTGPGLQRGQRPRAQMGSRGQGPDGQPFAGGPRAGRGMQSRGWANQPDAGARPPADGQGPGPAQLGNRNVPPIEQMFDQADANNDGALTREEIRAFHEKFRPGVGRQGRW